MDESIGAERDIFNSVSSGFNLARAQASLEWRSIADVTGLHAHSLASEQILHAGLRSRRCLWDEGMSHTLIPPLDTLLSCLFWWGQDYTSESLPHTGTCEAWCLWSKHPPKSLMAAKVRAEGWVLRTFLEQVSSDISGFPYGLLKWGDTGWPVQVLKTWSFARFHSDLISWSCAHLCAETLDLGHKWSHCCFPGTASLLLLCFPPVP